MGTKMVEFQEALNFAKNNGYLYAIYRFCKQRNNFYLVADNHLYCYDDYLQEDTKIIIEVDKAKQKNFNKFLTEDRQFCFRLHNNYNIPQFIPLFDK
jgi:hypothetical protein